MKFSVLAAVTASVALLVGCNKSTPPTPASASVTNNFVPKEGQGKLRTIELWIGPEKVRAEMALTPIQEATGLMYRTQMDENSGMIFVLPEPERASFWMTNCPLPLAGAYIDPEGTISEIHEMKENDPTPVLSKVDNVQFVLEMNKGWFDRHHIPTGTLISTEHGSLPQVFLQRR